MLPGLDNSGRKQLETKIEDNCVVRWSKPLGDYIMNFYDQKKYRARKRSPEGTRGANEVGGRAQGVRAHLPPSWKPHVLPRLLLIFLFS